MGALGSRRRRWRRRSASCPTSCARPTPPSSTCARRSTTSSPWSTPPARSPIAPALLQAPPRHRPRLGADGQASIDRQPPGPKNDLTELTRRAGPLAQVGVGPVDRNGASRPRPAAPPPTRCENSLTEVSTLCGPTARAHGLVQRLRALRRPRRQRRHRADRDHRQHLQRRLPSAGVPCNDSSRSSSSRAAPARPAHRPGRAHPDARHQGPPAMPRRQRARPDAPTRSPRAAPSTAIPARPRSDHEKDPAHTRRCSRPSRPGSWPAPARPTPTPTRPSSSTPSASSTARTSGSPASRPGPSPTSTSPRRRRALVTLRGRLGLPRVQGRRQLLL